MRKSALLFSMLLIGMFTMPGFSQVIADFETGTNGFVTAWGNALTNLSQAADPTSESAGVLSLSVNADLGDTKAAIKVPGPLDYGAAKVIAYYIWIPANTPGNLVIKTWVQGAGWQWNDDPYNASSIAKETWYPIYFNIDRRTLPEGPFEEMGLEVYGGNLTGTDTTWTGDILIDNVSLLGVEPKEIADFENDLNTFTVGWGGGLVNLYQTADPTSNSAGVMAIDYNADLGDTKAAVKKPGPVEHNNANLVCYYIWLPANTPDNLLVKAWAQGAGWQWNDDPYLASTITKETWYPIYFDPRKRTMPEGNYEEMGLEIYGGDLTGADSTFSATIYIDNVSFLTTETGKKWVQADFENETGGVSGFGDRNWGPAMDGLAWAVDPTGRSAGVLTSNWTFAGNPDGEKDSFGRFADLGWTETDTGATAVSLDVFIPEDFPTELVFSFWGANDPWTENQFSLSDTSLVAGQWNTLVFDVIGNVENGYDPVGSKELGIQIFSLSAVTYSAQIVFDNFTLWGIEKPQAPLQSPSITVTDMVEDGAHIEWVDNEDNLQETYNIYMSKSPISDLSSAAVTKIASQIARGNQSWWHRPASSKIEQTNYYYAVTATSSDGEETGLTDNNRVGPVLITSYIPPKAVYDNNFSSSFFLDADISEFRDGYPDYIVAGDAISGDSAQVAAWEGDPLHLDLYWEASFVIDDNYLYIGVQVLDDDLTTDHQAWEGDAWELFIGLYDNAAEKEWHDLGSLGEKIDMRMGFHADGTTHYNGGDAFAFPGLVSGTDYIIEPSLVGYTIEARLNLDSLAVDGFVPDHGMMMPMKVDCNDIDVTVGGDAGRSLQFQLAGLPVANNWQRPSGFNRLMVFDPNEVAIEDENQIVPLTTALKANYPNPFNPSTTINFDLAAKGEVSLSIYNVLGQKVTTLYNGVKEAGSHKVVWNGLNEAGAKAVSGIYFIQMNAKDYSATKKMLLVK